MTNKSHSQLNAWQLLLTLPLVREREGENKGETEIFHIKWKKNSPNHWGLWETKLCYANTRRAWVCLEIKKIYIPNIWGGQLFFQHCPQCSFPTHVTVLDSKVEVNNTDLKKVKMPLHFFSQSKHNVGASIFRKNRGRLFQVLLITILTCHMRPITPQMYIRHLNTILRWTLKYLKRSFRPVTSNQTESLTLMYTENCEMEH